MEDDSSEEGCSKDRKSLYRTSSIRVIERDVSQQCIIEHVLTQCYLRAEDKRVICEPLKKNDDNFVYMRCSYTVFDSDFDTNDDPSDDPKMEAGTFSHRSSYVYVTDEKTIVSQKTDDREYAEEIPDGDPKCFISRPLPGGYICFESVKYRKYFVAVNDQRLVLKYLEDFSNASDDAEIQFQFQVPQ